MSKQKAQFEHQSLVQKLNAGVGSYQSVNMKIDWQKQDPVLFELAEKRIGEIEERIQDEYNKNQKEERTQKIIELENQALVIDDAAMQKEILKGNFKLRISNKMKNPFKIEKYAQEPVAYFLHKNRDFLQRLYSKKDQFEKKDIYEFQGHLKYVAGESPEGKRRITRLKNKRENSLNKLGITIGEKKQGWFTRKEKNLAEIPESAQTKTPNEIEASQKLSPNRSNSNIL